MIANYFKTIWQVLTSPGQFFKKVPSRGGISGPLAFALITHWIGSALAYLAYQASGKAFFQKFFELTRDQSEIDFQGRSYSLQQLHDRISEWYLGVGTVVIDPFTTLVSLLFTSALVYAGARIFVSSLRTKDLRTISYESAVRVVSYSMAPQILSGIPFLGPGIASIYTLVVTIIAAREMYRIGTGRAIVIALFPKLLGLAAIFSGVLLFFFLLFNLFSPFI